MNNAGILRTKPFVDFTTDDFNALISTNLLGAVGQGGTAWPEADKLFHPDALVFGTGTGVDLRLETGDLCSARAILSNDLRRLPQRIRTR